MELYVNSKWTQCYGNSYIAEAIAWSENGNHATICTMGNTADEDPVGYRGSLYGSTVGGFRCRSRYGTG